LSWKWQVATLWDELDVYDDPELAADFKRQHHALDVIHEYLVLHPIAN
jgi:hypothetical protein